jgi:hypothetical protein
LGSFAIAKNLSITCPTLYLSRQFNLILAPPEANRENGGTIQTQYESNDRLDEEGKLSCGNMFL